MEMNIALCIRESLLIIKVIGDCYGKREEVAKGN